MDERKRYEQGMKVRRAVLGDAHVERSLKNRTDFNEEFQELLTRYAWGEIWTRPGLKRSVPSNSIVPATRRRPPIGVAITCACSSERTRVGIGSGHSANE